MGPYFHNFSDIFENFIHGVSSFEGFLRRFSALQGLSRFNRFISDFTAIKKIGRSGLFMFLRYL